MCPAKLDSMFEIRLTGMPVHLEEAFRILVRKHRQLFPTHDACRKK